MTIQELRKLVSQGEGARLEFKRKATYPVKIMKEVVAFANQKGGKLLIGVDDDGTIVGLKDAVEEEFVLENAIKKHCKPAVNYSLSHVRITDKRSVLVFDIEQSEKKPVFLIYNFRRNLGRAYIRIDDKSVQTSREVRKVLQANSSQKDIGFNYGEHEQALMHCFKSTSQINVKDFAARVNIPILKASDILIRLTIANVLEVHPTDDGDYFTMKDINRFLS
ncbi:AlbA family DNA-binding domain-containing protein [Flexithrix dorotheae]|uniref:AlbA family DNA-binding domain-containing protein n=1 Tax=Flexithrix dorotheae TaxID=70993 RepID=UPI0004769BE1|nr:ATP-binding protein [Flexithrix dorotheae]